MLLFNANTTSARIKTQTAIVEITIQPKLLIPSGLLSDTSCLSRAIVLVEVIVRSVDILDILEVRVIVANGDEAASSVSPTVGVD